MRLTAFDNDDRRLLKALALACGLYGGLLCIAVVVRFPDARLTENAYGPIQITLAPAKQQNEASVRKKKLAPAHAETERKVQPVVTKMPQALPAVESHFEAETLRVENPLSATFPGEQTFPASSATVIEPNDGVNTLAEGQGFLHGQVGQIEQDVAEKAQFVAWLDAEIRERLVYPDKARRRNIEGVVTVRLTVTADGVSCETVVSGGSASTLLDRAAVELVQSLFPAKISPGKEFNESIRIAYRLVGN